MAGELIENVSGNEYQKVANGAVGDTVIQNADGTKSMGASRSPGTVPYKVNMDTSTPPGSGEIRWDSAAQTVATEIYIDNISDEGVDYSLFASEVINGDGLYLQDQLDPGKYQYWSLDVVFSQPGYQRYKVTLISSAGADFTPGSKILVSFRPDAGILHTIADVSRGGGGPPTGTPEASDEFLFYDIDDGGTAKLALIRDIAAANITDAFVSGSGSNIATTGTLAPLPIFTNNFYTSAVGVIARDIFQDEGFIINAPLRFVVTCTCSMRTNATDDFVFQIFSDNQPIGEELDVSGDGNQRARNFTLRAFTGVMTPGGKIELRVRNGGDTINSITATMDIQFAGVT